MLWWWYDNDMMMIVIWNSPDPLGTIHNFWTLSTPSATVTENDMMIIRLRRRRRMIIKWGWWYQLSPTNSQASPDKVPSLTQLIPMVWGISRVRLGNYSGEAWELVGRGWGIAVLVPENSFPKSGELVGRRFGISRPTSSPDLGNSSADAGELVWGISRPMLGN